MSTQEFLIPARPDLAAAREEWLRALARERRLAELTVEAYERDTRQFLHFLTGHCGGAPGLKDIAALRRCARKARRSAGRSLAMSFSPGAPPQWPVRKCRNWRVSRS